MRCTVSRRGWSVSSHAGPVGAGRAERRGRPPRRCGQDRPGRRLPARAALPATPFDVARDPAPGADVTDPMPTPPGPGPLPVPPVAERRPHTLTRADGSQVDDPWFWLREREDPAVLAYLEAENGHTAAHLDPLQPLQDRLFAELKGRAEETDSSAPVLDGGWLYHHRSVAGQAYPIRCRRPAPFGVRDPRV